MKKVLLTICILSLFAVVWVACDKQTTPTTKETHRPAELSPSQEAALLEYKNSDHEWAFGWFSGWSPESPSISKSLRSLPDSVDMVSLWNNYWPLSEAQIADKEFVQKHRGIKLIVCVHTQYLPDKYKPMTTESIQKWAKDLVDSVYKYDYDGIDLDWEPTVCGCTPDFKAKSTEMSILVAALGQFLGPKSGTGKLLCVDGEPDQLQAVCGQYIDYAISQAYNCASAANLQGRYTAIKNAIGIRPEQHIVTENFESYWSTGGNVNFTDTLGKKMPSILGMAGWKPTGSVRKGGAGTYHMEYEYMNTQGDYYYLRQAIQIMNPTKK